MSWPNHGITKDIFSYAPQHAWPDDSLGQPDHRCPRTTLLPAPTISLTLPGQPIQDDEHNLLISAFMQKFPAVTYFVHGSWMPNPKQGSMTMRWDIINTLSNSTAMRWNIVNTLSFEGVKYSNLILNTLMYLYTLIDFIIRVPCRYTPSSLIPTLYAKFLTHFRF